MTQERTQTKLHWLIASWGFVVIWLSLFLVLHWQFYAPGIAGEIWYFLDELQQWQQAIWLEKVLALFQPFAGSHILLTAKLIFFADLTWFGGSGWLTTSVSLISIAACYLASLLLLPANQRRNPAVIVVAAILWFSPLQLYGVTIQSALHFFLSIAFAMFSCWAVAVSRWWLALGFAVLTLCSSAAGMALMIFLMLFGIRALYVSRVWRVDIITVVIIAAICVFFSWPKAMPADTAVAALLWNTFSLWLQLLSLPLAIYGDYRLVGLIMLGATVPSVLRFIQGKPLLGADYLILFGTLLLLSIAVGRAKVMYWHGEMLRYYIFFSPFLLGLLMLFMPSVRKIKWCVTILFVLCGLGLGLPVLAVTQSVGQKLALANANFFTGDTMHYARLKLDVFQRDDVLSLQRDYLQQQPLDVFYRVPLVPELDDGNTNICRFYIASQRYSSRKAYRDWWMASAEPMELLLGLDSKSQIKIQGAKIALQLPLDGWFLTPKTFSWREHWQLLLPLSWLSAEQTRWFIYSFASRRYVR